MVQSSKDLQDEIEELRHQLREANDTLEAIREGQIDALVVASGEEHQVYTLATADHSYRVFIEKMIEGAVTLNVQGDIQYCNSRFAAMVEQPLAKVIGASFASFITERSKPNFINLVEEGWKKESKGEVLLATAHNSQLAVQLSFTALELESGLSLSIIITDLSVQKATQRQLEDSNHDLQQFASVASHDLQEPLRKIQIYSNLIRENQSELSANNRQYLDKIVESSSRMRTLIIDILTYSRLSAEDVAMEPIPLDAMFEELRDDFELLIREKQAVLTIGSLPVLTGNKGQIRQVFQNIISNALKFSRPGIAPEINISCRYLKEKSFDSELSDQGPYCLLHIKDNGIGFDDQYVANIFALFERLNTKDAYSGTGIGLAIAKKIIEKHNGLITATGIPGSGADFMIILPIQ